MKKSTLVLLSTAFLMSACGGIYGVVNSFQVHAPFTLEDDYSNDNSVTFQVGAQNSQAWKAYAFEKNDKIKTVPSQIENFETIEEIRMYLREDLENNIRVVGLE